MVTSAAAASSPRGLDLEDEIRWLKRERRAVLLAHYYQESEIQDLADFLGDSLALAQAARKTDAEVIAFAGVHFMAETAKILNPEKTVVVPSLEAGCSLADACPAPVFRAWRARHPEHVAITYINCSAQVKALSDIICTSSNAERIVRSVPDERPILFAPDRHLGRYLMKKTGRAMTLWDGTYIVHEQFNEKALAQLKVRHPEAEVIAHPECDESVLAHADFIGSTSKLLARVEESAAPAFIVATEQGIFHQMQKQSPHKRLFAAPGSEGCACNVCPHMKRNTLELLAACLRDLSPRIELSEEIRAPAGRALDRMLALSSAGP